MNRLSIQQFKEQELSFIEIKSTLGGTTYNNFCNWYMNITANPNPTYLQLFAYMDSIYTNIQIVWDELTNTLISISYDD